jgi:hypothetical protein
VQVFSIDAVPVRALRALLTTPAFRWTSHESRSRSDTDDAVGGGACAAEAKQLHTLLSEIHTKDEFIRRAGKLSAAVLLAYERGFSLMQVRGSQRPCPAGS